MKFQSGDRVIAIKKYGLVMKGETGTYVHTETDFPKYGVRWDRHDPQKHTCGGNCERGHGFYVPYEVLEFDNVPDFGDLSDANQSAKDILFDL